MKPWLKSGAEFQHFNGDMEQRAELSRDRHLANLTPTWPRLVPVLLSLSHDSRLNALLFQYREALYFVLQPSPNPVSPHIVDNLESHGLDQSLQLTQARRSSALRAQGGGQGCLVCLRTDCLRSEPSGSCSQLCLDRHHPAHLAALLWLQGQLCHEHHRRR